MPEPESAAPAPVPSGYVIERTGDSLDVRLNGAWKLEAGLPRATDLVQALESGEPVRHVAFQAGALSGWDSGLLSFVHGAALLAEARGAEVDLSGLPESARRMLALARAVPARAAAPLEPVDDALSARVGGVTLRAWDTAGGALRFLGEVTLAFWAFVRGRARFRGVDLMHAIETTGAGALGIVALVNFLIGAVLAFVGAVQLQQFGASIYVADLVAIAVARELGALMTGVVMAGRTGASYAAVLGTMTVNEEVDAIVTMGLRPVEFLVMPRVLAAALMLPALVAYADVVGILGGTFVGVVVLRLGPSEYLLETRDALTIGHLMVGLGKSIAFGAVVALTGCYYGIRCGRSAAAVGTATTRAVVMGILLVVVTDAIFTVLLYVLQV